MELDLGPEIEQFRHELRDWIAEHAPTELGGLIDWRVAAIPGGYRAPELAEAGQAAHATQAEPGAGLEPSARQPPAADVSPEWGAQAEAETDEPEIEL